MIKKVVVNIGITLVLLAVIAMVLVWGLKVNLDSPMYSLTVGAVLFFVGFFTYWKNKDDGVN